MSEIGCSCTVTLASGNREGVVKFVGETSFAKGEWIGVELFVAEGKNNGSVNGIEYFKTKENYGLFLKRNAVTIKKKEVKTPPATILLSTSIPVVPTTKSSPPLSFSSFSVGQNILVLLKDKEKRGIIRFIGETKFASGEWYGVELEDAEGKNNGSVNGIEYFKTKENHGLFLKKLSLKAIEVTEAPKPIKKKAGTEKSTSSSTTVAKKSIIKKMESDTVNTYPFKLNQKVFVKTTTGEKRGEVCFIGPTLFGEGIWYGIKMSLPIGKNNGTIKNVEYFTCKENFGLFVKENVIRSDEKKGPEKGRGVPNNKKGSEGKEENHEEDNYDVEEENEGGEEIEKEGKNEEEGDEEEVMTSDVKFDDVERATEKKDENVIEKVFEFKEDIVINKIKDESLEIKKQIEIRKDLEVSKDREIVKLEFFSLFSKKQVNETILQLGEVVRPIFSIGKNVSVLVKEILDAAATVLPFGNNPMMKKYCALFAWIASHVNYDVKHGRKSIAYDATGLDNILNTGLAVYSGYTMLMNKMCQEAGLKSYEVFGYAKGNGFKMDLFSNTTNHSWIAVILDDNNYYLSEVVWGSGAVGANKLFVRKLDERHALQEPCEFIYKHYPADLKFLFLPQGKIKSPVSREEFLSFINIEFEYSELEIELDAKGFMVASSSEELIIPFKTLSMSREIKLFGTLLSPTRNEKIFNRVLIDQNKKEIIIRLPKLEKADTLTESQRLFTLNIYGKSNKELNLLPLVAKILIEQSAESSIGLSPFPELSEYYFDFGIKLSEPLQGCVETFSKDIEIPLVVPKDIKAKAYLYSFVGEERLSNRITIDQKSNCMKMIIPGKDDFYRVKLYAKREGNVDTYQPFVASFLIEYKGKKEISETL